MQTRGHPNTALATVLLLLAIAMIVTLKVSWRGVRASTSSTSTPFHSPLPATSKSAARSSTQAPISPIHDVQQDLAETALRQVNRLRSTGGRCGKVFYGPAKRLVLEPRLIRAALLHARDQASHLRMSHRGNDGSTPSQRVTRSGYPWIRVSENVAFGQRSVSEVISDWMESPGHCRNVLDPNVEAMGFGCAQGADGRLYWTQVFASSANGLSRNRGERRDHGGPRDARTTNHNPTTRHESR